MQIRAIFLFPNTFKFPFRIELKIVEALLDHDSKTEDIFHRNHRSLLWFLFKCSDISFFLAKSLTSCFSKCPWTRKASEVTFVKQRQEKLALRLGIEAVFTCQHSPKSAWHNAVWGQLLPWHLETQLPPQRMDLKVCKSCSPFLLVFATATFILKTYHAKPQLGTTAGIPSKIEHVT